MRASLISIPPVLSASKRGRRDTTPHVCPPRAISKKQHPANQRTPNPVEQITRSGISERPGQEPSTGESLLQKEVGVREG